MSLLDKVLERGYGQALRRVVNADGKAWVMPVKGMRTGMQLYQPSGTKGKALKTLYPWLCRVGLVNKAIHAESLKGRLNDDLFKLLVECFRTMDLQFSIFEGTPSAHQKMTIQLWNDDKILGYCKVTDNAEVRGLIQQEQKVLQTLCDKGVNGIPRVLYCGEVADTHVFVQSTEKTSRSKVIHSWGPLQEQFLADLQTKTMQRLLFDDSDFCKNIRLLQSHLDWLAPEHQEIVGKAISHVLDNNSGKEVDYCAYHADFTPWNMFVTNGRLFVFDWEYAQLTYPAGLDRYHFFTQTAIFERHTTPEDIINNLKRKNKFLNQLQYILYLLDIIGRYTLRSKGNLDIKDTYTMKIWFKILGVMIQKEKTL